VTFGNKKNCICGTMDHIVFQCPVHDNHKDHLKGCICGTPAHADFRCIVHKCKTEKPREVKAFDNPDLIKRINDLEALTATLVERVRKLEEPNKNV